jgi:DNA polymerase-3 subunit delta'
MIEEPPQRALILIVSHRPGQVMATIRSRCRKLRLERLTPDDIIEVVAGLGAPWSELGNEAITQAGARADGSARAALARLDPSAQGLIALIDQTIEQLPSPDPRLVVKLAEAIGARAQKDAYEAFHRAIFDWLAAAAGRSAAAPARAAAIAELFERVRTAARETDALNLDRKLHVIALFADIAASARGL